MKFWRLTITLPRGRQTLYARAENLYRATIEAHKQLSLVKFAGATALKVEEISEHTYIRNTRRGE